MEEGENKEGANYNVFSFPFIFTFRITMLKHKIEMLILQLEFIPYIPYIIIKDNSNSFSLQVYMMSKYKKLEWRLMVLLVFVLEQIIQ